MGSIPLPEIYCNKRSDGTPLTASLVNSNILLAEPHDKKILELSNVAEIPSGVEVNKIFDGPKVFFKQKIKGHIIMFEHKNHFSQNLVSSCIEIVSYIYGYETAYVSRIFVTTSKVFPRLRNKLIVKGSQHAQESISSYM
jgi:hypothetical protein